MEEERPRSNIFPDLSQFGSQGSGPIHLGKTRRQKRKLRGKAAQRRRFRLILLKGAKEFNCPGCGRSFPAEDATLDHIVPIARDGPNELGNLQLMCRPCNNVKGATMRFDRNDWTRVTIEDEPEGEVVVYPPLTDEDFRRAFRGTHTIAPIPYRRDLFFDVGQKRDGEQDKPKADNE